MTRAGPRPPRDRRPKPITEVAVLSIAERDALTTLKHLQNADCNNNALVVITASITILRPRDAWAQARAAARRDTDLLISRVIPLTFGSYNVASCDGGTKLLAGQSQLDSN